MIRRRLSALPAASLLVAAGLCLSLGSACRTATEIVVRVDVEGDPGPATFDIVLTRTLPFNDVPMVLPPNISPFLGRTDLVLRVTPTGARTSLSLLPPIDKTLPRDVTVSVRGAGWNTAPEAAQTATFEDNTSQEMRFTLTPRPPEDGGVKDAGIKDGGATGDAGAGDLAVSDAMPGG